MLTRRGSSFAICISCVNVILWFRVIFIYINIFSCIYFYIFLFIHIFILYLYYIILSYIYIYICVYVWIYVYMLYSFCVCVFLFVFTLVSCWFMTLRSSPQKCACGEGKFIHIFVTLIKTTTNNSNTKEEKTKGVYFKKKRNRGKQPRCMYDWARSKKR